MNAEELKRNKVLTEWSVKDLNEGKSSGHEVCYEQL